ncbi:MAG: glycosyltransferase, partial [Verrucomicrobiaceae bacterium]
FLLLFVQGFGQYTGPGTPTTFPTTPSNRLARFCFHLLAPAVRSGRVVLASETRGMQDELQRFTGLPVTLFPHPVPPPPETDKQPPVSGLQPTASGLRPPVSDSITITCPGFARHEKGNDLLQEAIEILLAGPDSERLRFVVQWPEPFAMPDGSMLAPDPALVSDPRVEFLNYNLDSEAYEVLLARTDLVVLPYRRNSYHQRVSRVAIEAASRGIPLVYMADTWSAEVAALAGDGSKVDDESHQAVVSALRRATCGLTSLRETVHAGAADVASFHSAEGFRRRLLEISQG